MAKAKEVLTKAVWNGDLGETEIVPLTAEELAQRELDIAAAEAARLERETADAKKAEDKASAIAALVALGLTEDQIAALVG